MHYMLTSDVSARPKVIGSSSSTFAKRLKMDTHYFLKLPFCHSGRGWSSTQEWGSIYTLYAQYKDSYQVLDHHLHIRSLDHGTFAGPDATGLKMQIIYLATFLQKDRACCNEISHDFAMLIGLVDITHILSCLRFAPEGTSHFGWEETAAEAAGNLFLYLWGAALLLANSITFY